MRFNHLEGLRGWLALAVALGHFCAFLDLRQGVFWKVVGAIPSLSVSIFILISGFVIANLVMVSQENYSLYITRRVLRLFPVYAICAGVGIFTNILMYQIIRDGSLSHVIGAEFSRETAQTVESVYQYFWQHFLAHVLLVQGAVPDTVVPFISRSFLPPGWSLSLEWQFYLIAPLWIYLIREPRKTLLGFLACILMLLCYKYYLEKMFRLPSALPGKAGLFYAGIMSRVYFTNLRAAYDNLRGSNLRFPVILMLIFGGLSVLFPQNILGIIWVAFIILTTADAAGMNWVLSAGRAVALATLNSVFANWIGARSYSIYACHWPCIELSAYLASQFPFLKSNLPLWFCVWLGLLVCATELLFRYVERPLLRFSRNLKKRQLTGPSFV